MVHGWLELHKVCHFFPMWLRCSVTDKRGPLGGGIPWNSLRLLSPPLQRASYRKHKRYPNKCSLGCMLFLWSFHVFWRSIKLISRGGKTQKCTCFKAAFNQSFHKCRTVSRIHLPLPTFGILDDSVLLLALPICEFFFTGELLTKLKNSYSFRLNKEWLVKIDILIYVVFIHVILQIWHVWGLSWPIIRSVLDK